MGEKVGEYFRLPITLIDDGKNEAEEG